MAPSQSRRRPRRRFGLMLAVGLVGASVGIASAAPSRPSISVTPTVTGTSASVVVAVNRVPKAIASCTYTLDAGAVNSCGTASAVGKKGAAYTISLTGLSAGEHTIAVSVGLTDGGRGTASASFTIEGPPPRVFARAWTDVVFDQTYDPTDDVLISELVDTNRDGVVSVGDTITTNQFPLGFDHATAGFGDFRVTSHTVTGLSNVQDEDIQVSVGSSVFDWTALSGWEDYGEGSTRLFDNGGLAVDCDRMTIDPSSPSQPDVAAASTVETRCPGGEEDPIVINGDDSFLEVTIDLSN